MGLVIVLFSNAIEFSVYNGVFKLLNLGVLFIMLFLNSFLLMLLVFNVGLGCVDVEIGE